MAASGQTRWPPTRRSRGGALTPTLERRGTAHRALTAGGVDSQPSTTDSRRHHHHEPTLIAAASSRTTAGSRRGTFSQAELTADEPVRNVSPAPNEHDGKRGRSCSRVPGRMGRGGDAPPCGRDRQYPGDERRRGGVGARSGEQERGVVVPAAVPGQGAALPGQAVQRTVDQVRVLVCLRVAPRPPRPGSSEPASPGPADQRASAKQMMLHVQRSARNAGPNRGVRSRQGAPSDHIADQCAAAREESLCAPPGGVWGCSPFRRG